MDLELTADQRLFAETTRRFLEGEAPLSRTRQLYDRGIPWESGYWRTAGELGWTSLLAPEAVGGGSISGNGLLDLAIVAEEMGRLVAPGPLLSTNVVVAALGRDLPVDRHAAVLGPLIAGEATAAWAFDAGTDPWDPASVRATARRDGEVWVLDGVAAFVLDSPAADWLLVPARTGAGLTQFLVPAGTEGLTVTARASLDLVRPVGDVVLSGVRLHPSAVVGEVEAAGDEVEQQLLTALVLQNAETVGALDRVLAFTLDYARDRVAFGRPIASYQALKHRFADLQLRLQACLATSSASARAVAEGSARAAELVGVAASYIAAHAPGMVQDCVQLHGGIGVTWDHDLHLYLRRVTQNAVLLGGARHHRERLAARLGMGEECR